MVIDELIARLGFRIDGLDALKNAMARFREFVKSILSAVNPLKKAGAAANPLRTGLTKVGAAAAPATAAMGRMAAVAKVVAVGVTSIIGAAAGASVAIIALAKAFSKAARARREFQIEAQGQGTTAKRFDLLRNALAAQAGVGEKKAEKSLSTLLDGVNELRSKALAGDPEARAGLAKYGLNARDKKGRPVDSSALALSAASQFIERNARAEELRKRGKDKEATRLDERNRQFGDEFGITGELAAILRTFPDVKALEAALKSAGERAPGPTSEQESRDARMGRELAELEQKLKTIGDVFTEVGKKFGEALLPLANFIADNVIKPLKAIGAIPKTAAEQEADAKAVAIAAKEAGEAAWEARRERGTRNAPEATSGQRRRDAAADAPAKLEELRRRNAAPEPYPPMPPRRNAAPEPKPATRDSALPTWQAKPPEWMTTIGKALPDLTSIMQTLNRQALATLSADRGFQRQPSGMPSAEGGERNVTAEVKPDQITAKADVGVKTDVTLRVEPSSELLKIVATAKSAGAQMGAMIAKSANTATASATAP
jgi:hypothetical protein